MQFDLEALSPSQRYKVMASVITPRPIAWVTSLDSDDRLNVAPFSFFNMFGDDPPTVALGIMLRNPSQLKDTAANIRARKEFVVNLVGENEIEAMNATSIDAPPSVNEADLFGINVTRSVKVAPPRITDAPASFECRLSQIVETSSMQSIVIGEAIHGHVKDELILDPIKFHIDVPAMHLVGRMHGAGWYARTTDLFDLRRPIWPLEE